MKVFFLKIVHYTIRQSSTQWDRRTNTPNSPSDTAKFIRGVRHTSPKFANKLYMPTVLFLSFLCVSLYRQILHCIYSELKIIGTKSCRRNKMGILSGVSYASVTSKLNSDSVVTYLFYDQ